ncbi:phosphoglycerate kinase [Candidatus Saccharibacteria bacterium]|nr:phosphoglycerate kinase [Candidatus Saccharibacteria bacterium]
MNFFKKTVYDVPLEKKIVLVRADYNVPMTEDGKISDDLRIRASLPTLKYLIKQGCRVVVMSHLGRPDGRPLLDFSLEPVAERLSELINLPVNFVDDCVGDKVAQAVRKLRPGQILLLENLRFHPEEEKNSLSFAKDIAMSVGARYFVQDGFGVVHRAHTSTSAIDQYIPGVAGLLLQKEITTIEKAISSPKRPLVAVLGGAKVSDKIGVIESFVSKADRILIGGAMANTFLRYKGHSMGASKVESDQDDVIRSIYRAASDKVGSDKVDDFIILPKDLAVAKSVGDTQRLVVPVDRVPSDSMALDIGDKTIDIFCEYVKDAKTVIWNGTLGYSERRPFSHGSARLALALASDSSIKSIIGGGDTADFVLKWDGQGGKSFSHISTGGGASLDLMAGKTLPGVEALLDAKK